MSRDSLFTPLAQPADGPCTTPGGMTLLPAPTSLNDVLQALNRAADAQTEANALLSEAYDKLAELEAKIPEDAA